jgi:hypothetical protein
MTERHYAHAAALTGQPGSGHSPAACPVEESPCPVVGHEWIDDEYKHLVVKATPKGLAAQPEAGMINSIGLPTKGLGYFLEVQLPDYRRYTPPLVASVTSTDIDDFAAMAREVSVPGVSAIELNISCPTRAPGGDAHAAVGHALAQRGGHLGSGGGGGEGRCGRDHRVDHDPRPQDRSADVPLLDWPGLRRDLRPGGEGDHPAHGSPVRANMGIVHRIGAS